MPEEKDSCYGIPFYPFIISCKGLIYGIKHTIEVLFGIKEI